MEIRKIGLLGLTSTSINKGCEALTYAFLEMLKQYQDFSYELYFIDGFSLYEFRTGKLFARIKSENARFEEYGVSISRIFYRTLYNKILFSKEIRKLDICFDFTQGDSFTDIYGNARFNDWTKVKEYIINKGVPLVLGSQTIGPFHDKENEKRAAAVINSCKEVFARDKDSFEYTKSISGRTPILTTDVAFFLPYKDTGYKKSNKIGFNPSGLLWNGGYTSDNQFGLTMDYQDFCRKAITYAIKNGFEVHLIGHVVSDDLLQKDNDCVAIKALHEEFPETIVAPMFDNPMDAKTYISNMSAFTGARMHATIASISAGVPVLPFSYSRKFEGLFGTLKYEHIIHGKGDSLDEALTKFRVFIERSDDIIKDVNNSIIIINKMKRKMLQSYQNLLIEEDR